MSNYREIYLTLYVVSGVLQPIIMQVLTNNGACERSTMLFVLPNCIGASLSVISNWKSINQGKFNWKWIIALCLLDTFSQLCVTVGLVFAGSMLFSILYSACTFWTAILSRIILNKKLKRRQWIGVVAVCFGLAIAVNGSISIINAEVSYGGILIVAGSMFHSLMFIFVEIVLSKENNPIAPEMLSSVMGLFGVMVCGSWQIVYTIPNFHRLVIEEVISHQGDSTIIIFGYLFLTIVDLLHALSFFHLIGLIGATTTGLLKGVQSAAIFIVSHYAFCSYQKSQCFSAGKGAAVASVIIGIICYSCDFEDGFFIPKSVCFRPQPPSLIPTIPRTIKIV